MIRLFWQQHLVYLTHKACPKTACADYDSVPAKIITKLFICPAFQNSSAHQAVFVWMLIHHKRNIFHQIFILVIYFKAFKTVMYRYKHLITGRHSSWRSSCIADDRTAHSADIFFYRPKRMHYERIKKQGAVDRASGQRPEIRSTEAGKKLARFSVATDEIYRSSTGEK